MITMVDAQRVHGRWRTSAYVVALTAVVAVASSLLLVPPVHATHEAPAERGVEEACPPRQVPDPGFDDVGGNAHEAAIACIAAWDIAEGRNATVYDPAGRTRRDQMASFIVRMLDTAGSTSRRMRRRRSTTSLPATSTSRL